MSHGIIGKKVLKGRGALSNPAGRFESKGIEAFHDGWYVEEEPNSVETTLTPDHAKGVITKNDSPDIGFDYSINPYRGCSHGCVYCFARPSHAYMGLSPGIDFETKLFAKTNAAELLRKELAKPGHVCSPINLGANTDPVPQILDLGLLDALGLLELAAILVGRGQFGISLRVVRIEEVASDGQDDRQRDEAKQFQPVVHPLQVRLQENGAEALAV